MRNAIGIAILAAIVLTASAAPAADGDSPQWKTPSEDVWIGKLVDADCKSRDPEPPCPVGAATKAFGMSVGGGYLLSFDERGNELARELIRETGAAGNVPARAVGEREGRTLKVRDLRLEPPPSS